MQLPNPTYLPLVRWMHRYLRVGFVDSSIGGSYSVLIVLAHQLFTVELLTAAVFANMT